MIKKAGYKLYLFFCFVIALIFIINVRDLRQNFALNIAVVAVLPLLLLFSDSTGILKKNTKNPSFKKKVAVWSAAVILTGASVAPIAVLIYCAFHLNEMPLVQQTAEQLAFGVYALLAVMFFFFLWIFLFNPFNGSKWLYFYLSGALMTVLRMIDAFSNVSSFDQLEHNAVNSLYFFGLGIVLSLAAILLVPIYKRISLHRPRAVDVQ